MKVPHRYTRESFFGTLFEIIYQRWIKRRTLIVDFNLKPGVLPGPAKYSRNEYWTDAPVEEICANGYKEAEGLHDSIIWSRVRIYAKINNGVEFDIEQYFPEKKDTAYTLNDAMQSNTDKEFKKSMARAQLTSSADWQKLGLMALLGVGVIIATKFFGIW